MSSVIIQFPFPDELVEKYQIVFCYLFGSQAVNKISEISDIDQGIILYCKNRIKLADFKERTWKLYFDFHEFEKKHLEYKYG